jgi:type 1 fimbria pilin
MQLRFLLAWALSPLSVSAVATAEADSPDAAVDSRAIVRPQYCTIVGGSSTVNCRTGPGTRYNVRTTLRKGTTHPFWCVVSAQCVTINGSVNW